MALAAQPRNWRTDWQRPAPLALGGVLLGVLAGLVVVRLGPLLPVLLLAGLVAGVLILTDPRWGLLATLAVAMLLPFGTLPFKVGLTPTLLECTLGLTWLVFALRLFLHREEQLLPTVVAAPLLLFVVVTLFAFVLGSGGSYTTSTLHDYVKLLLAISTFFLLVNLVRTEHDLAAALQWFVALGTVAAALGLVLWRLGPGAERLLARLAVVGYPTGKIIRYLEDDPAKAVRATGTGVDPNSFGGFLMVLLVLLVAQFAARRPLVPRWLTLPALPIVGVTLLLTQSRASWLGAAVGIVLLGVVRYRRLLPPMVLAVPAILVLGIGRSFIQRFILGVQLQDPATKLRLAEYQNALAIIRERPWFGIGFGAAPTIDLQAGVSSVYLSVATRLGLLGLLCYLAVLVVLAVQIWPFLVSRRLPDNAAREVVLALGAALAAAAVAGVLDHYFFNITFAHMVAIFWGLTALVVVATRLARVSPSPAVTPVSATLSGRRYSSTEQ